jgi:hypothetical protein
MPDPLIAPDGLRLAVRLRPVETGASEEARTSEATDPKDTAWRVASEVLGDEREVSWMGAERPLAAAGINVKEPVTAERLIGALRARHAASGRVFRTVKHVTLESP